ncbi:uncharacterized protein LAESUDRAFT_810145 [Laetiporus sulphureus 93-53]|uniref:Uncharacterized protein n=1 Tax=Laetiporus sulphureus 93-53 TaxID=1314785 RepID=A0A165GM97_9APHY|nr:uncharacterized protein LAESUDRAFT_810145 [Laetiporus sulphureus 93-53]KZT10547.1 hypothetical protein LAESUDRAFT_810145 [Laetiporus sulphureus 93-53]
MKMYATHTRTCQDHRQFPYFSRTITRRPSRSISRRSATPPIRCLATPSSSRRIASKESSSQPRALRSQLLPDLLAYPYQRPPALDDLAQAIFPSHGGPIRTRNVTKTARQRSSSFSRIPFGSRLSEEPEEPKPVKGVRSGTSAAKVVVVNLAEDSEAVGAASSTTKKSSKQATEELDAHYAKEKKRLKAELGKLEAEAQAARDACAFEQQQLKEARITYGKLLLRIRRARKRLRSLEEELDAIEQRREEELLLKEREAAAREAEQRALEEQREKAREEAEEKTLRDLFRVHEENWTRLQKDTTIRGAQLEQLSWSAFPWAFKSENDITADNVRAFVLHPLRIQVLGRSCGNLIQTEKTRYSAEFFIPYVVPKLVMEHRETAVKLAAIFAHALNVIYTQEENEKKRRNAGQRCPTAGRIGRIRCRD